MRELIGVKQNSKSLSLFFTYHNKKGIFILYATIFIMGLFSFCADKDKAEKASPFFVESETEKPEIVLISVYDNYMVNPELKTSWGFACVIETPAEKLLFDTGGDPVILLSNMQKMNIDPGSIDKVIISHVHGDHAGGLEGFLEKNNDVTVFIPASFPGSIKNMIINEGAGFIVISEAKKISDFIYSTGELEGPPQEQSIIIDSKKGLIVITGCAHPGIVKIVEKAKQLMEKDSLYLVTGGFHNPPMAVVKKFRALGVKKVAPSHCTGDRVREAFSQEYKEDFIEYGVGRRIEIK
ncbi:MAG: MBL fold metallo-hydrolase [Bacteroidales bacterium]|nr:MBL fold metallo-hydrolase [Bacteroidales bacterium]